MNPTTTPLTKETQVIQTHPYPIFLTVALSMLLFAQTPLMTSDNVPETLDDAAITTQVKMSLLFHLSLNFKVETSGGVVTLSGDADSSAEKDLNTRLATGIVGVKRVVNQMIIPLTLAGNN